MSEEIKEPTVDLAETVENKSEEPLTEVTSIAQEEAKTGVKIETPSPTELVARASASLISRLKEIEHILPRMSKKQIQRGVVAGLSLPASDMPIRLKSDEEKLLFALTQRVIADRFIVVQDAINKELQRIKAERAAEAAQASQTSSEQPQEMKENTNG